MHKAISFLSRIVLTLGVLIALTPCGICKNAAETNASEMKSCCMMHMDGKQDCCHSKKSPQPFCKVMDQSSVVPVFHGSVLVAKPVIVVGVVEALLPLQVCAVSYVHVVPISPPPGILALRI